MRATSLPPLSSWWMHRTAPPTTVKFPLTQSFFTVLSCLPLLHGYSFFSLLSTSRLLSFLSFFLIFSFFPPFPPATTKPLSIPVPYRQQVRRTGGVWVRQIVRSAPAQQREGRVDQTDHVHSGSGVARF